MRAYWGACAGERLYAPSPHVALRAPLGLASPQRTRALARVLHARRRPPRLNRARACLRPDTTLKRVLDG